MDSDYPLFASKYLLRKKLAVGGMGEIYLADQIAGHDAPREVVVKRILRRHAQNPLFVDMFLDEARLCARLKHDNIVNVFEVGSAEGMYFITMEHLDGRDLSQIMTQAVKQSRPFGVGNTLQIVHDIAAGADYAHRYSEAGVSLGIVHRDLSPRNLMVTFDGWAKILDFGLAKAATQTHMTLPGKIKGTPSYLAPEQLHGKPPTPLTDIFAMGTVLYEMTTLRRLFRRGTTLDTMRAVKACSIPPPSSLVHDYPLAVEAIVMKALARDPEDRYETAGHLRDALARVMGELGLGGRREIVGKSLRALFDTATSELPLMQDLAAADTTIADGLAAHFPMEVSSVLRDQSNLPIHKTRFLGRGAQVAELAEAMMHGTRFISLYGPPGTGKTRLAVEVAFTQKETYRLEGGAWLCEVDGARTIDDACAEVGRTLRFQLPAGATGDTLIAAVADALSARGPTLLVLDGLDRLGQPMRGVLQTWLDKAAELHLIVTAREHFALPGGVDLDVLPLALPAGMADVESSPAVLLFVDRARLMRPSWAPTDSEKAMVARIARRLDGIPLAIELAAGRMADLSPSELLDQLSRRFDVLKEPGGTSPLLDAIDWSWNLLEPFERAVLAQSSVFHGGFDMEAADAVIDLAAYPDAPWVVDVLERLRNKSLVRSYTAAGFPGEARCRQYASVRGFARQKLDDIGGLEAAMDRHQSHYLRVGRYWAHEAGHQKGIEGRRRLQLELPNLAAVHRRCVARQPATPARVADAMRAALVVLPVFNTRGPFGAYIRMLDETLALAEHVAEVDQQLRGNVLLARGLMKRVDGDMAGAKDDFTGVMNIARSTRDNELAGRGMTEMGTLRLVQGDSAGAQNILRRALAIHKANGDVEWQGRTLLAMGNTCLMRGDTKAARACFEAALPRFKAVGEPVLEGACLGNLGTLEQAELNLDAAQTYLLSAVARHRETGAQRFEGYALTCLGSVSHEQGRIDDARSYYESGLRALRAAGDRRWQGVTLGYIGVLLHEIGRLQSARKRLVRALELLNKTGDGRTAGFFMGALGAVLAAMGDRASSERYFVQAAAMARKTDDPLLGPAVDVYRCFSDLSESMAQSSPAAASLLRDAVRERLVAALVRIEPGNDTAMRSDLTDLYRLAVRILKATLEAVDRQEVSG